MSKYIGMWLWLVLSFILPALYVGAAFVACGVGHGDCRLMILFPILFPYALLLAEMFPNSIGILLILALGQFPLYVLALTLTRGTPRYGLVRNLILGLHCLAVVLALIVWP